MQQLAVHARFRALPGRVDELMTAVLDMFPRAAAEDGTLVYAAHRDRDDPDAVVMYELYGSDAALDRHGESQEAKQLGELLGDLLAEEPEVWFTRPVQALGIDAGPADAT